MISQVINFLHQHKSILILGFGKEGRSSYNFIRKYLPDIKLGIADKIAIDDFPIADKNLQFHYGENYLKSIKEYDLVLKTPGIPLEQIDDKSILWEKITSQTHLFLRFFHNQIIGVTGTKGKSTTVSLIYHILKLAKKPAILAGNIGKPIFDFLPEITPETLIILELSCHQLESCVPIHSPHIAVLLNIYEDHLDHYKNFYYYKQAKLNICKYQKEDDYFIFPITSDNKCIINSIRYNKIKSCLLPFTDEKVLRRGCYLEENKIIFIYKGRRRTIFSDVSSEIPLKGKHNILNIMSIINVCKVLNIADRTIREGIKTFKPLPHRLEYVGEFEGIHFYNDSISTVPESTISAINTLSSQCNVDTIILGGYNRGINYKKLIEFLQNSKIRNFIFMGETGRILLDKLKSQGTKKCYIHHLVEGQETTDDIKHPAMSGRGQRSNDKHFFYTTDMKDAVKIAFNNTEKGEICLLSPAAASYDNFKNFEHRGDMFKKCIKQFQK